jgi:hypothetical protein
VNTQGWGHIRLVIRIFIFKTIKEIAIKFRIRGLLKKLVDRTSIFDHTAVIHKDIFFTKFKPNIIIIIILSGVRLSLSHDPTRARSRAFAVGSRRLTAWAMARPRNVINLIKNCTPVKIICMFIWPTEWITSTTAVIKSAPSSDTDVHCYVFRLLDANSDIPPVSIQTYLHKQGFPSARLPTQGMMYPGWLLYYKDV